VKRTQQHEPEISHQARSVTASVRPPGVIVARMDTLRRRGEPQQAATFLKESLVADPAAAVGLLALLRAAARLDDARLLLELARNGEPALCSRVANALSEAGGDDDDAQYLLGALEQLDLSALIGILPPPDGAVSRHTKPLLSVALGHSPEEFVTTFEQLRRQQRNDDARILVSVLCQASADRFVAVARGLAMRQLMSDAQILIDSYAALAEPAEASSAFVMLTRFWPDAAAVSAVAIANRRDAVAVVQTLERAARHPSRPDPLADLVRLLSAPSIARLCHSLCSADTYDHVDAVLAQCAARADRDELRMALHELKLHSAAYHLTEHAGEISGGF
jgi:hypothetical protein